METQGYTSRLDDGPALSPVTAKGGWEIALLTLVVGGALGATIGWSAAHGMSAAGAVAALHPAIAMSAPAAPNTTSAVQNAHRSLDVAIPADGAYVKSTGIVVAGSAFGRPHGPRVTSVRVELYVADRLVERADLDVYASRFAGVLQVATPIGPAAAELRVSDPDHPTRQVTVRKLTIDTRTSGLGPTG